MTQLHQATVLLTGASGGFGQELIRQLLEAGSYLILTDLDEAVLQSRVAAIQSQVKTGKVLACLPADLATPEGCKILYDRVQELHCPIDILINNAGIGVFGRLDEIPTAKWERVMQVNLLAPMRLSALFVTDMIARRKGHIVNISSLAGWTAQAGLSVYSTSKFGLRGFSEGLFNEVNPYNVQVTAVYPFFSRTPILQSEQYGTLAKDLPGFPEHLATDPANVMRVTIQAIRRNQLHVFPDRIAKTVYWLQRYFPQLLTWSSNALVQRFKHGQGK